MAKRKGSGRLSDREFDARERRFIRILDGTFSLLRTTIRGLLFVFAIYVGGSYLVPFAGKETKLSAIMRAAVDLKADRYILGLAAMIGGGGWWQERRKRTKLIQQWGPYVRTLEEKVMPDRSSSGLLVTGQPRKEDADVL